MAQAPDEWSTAQARWATHHCAISAESQWGLLTQNTSSTLSDAGQQSKQGGICSCLVLGYVRSGMTESRADVAGLGTSRNPAAFASALFAQSSGELN